MSCNQDAFSIPEGVESVGAVKVEVIEFLDGDEWCEFVGAVSNDSCTVTDREIRTLVKKIRDGHVSPDVALKACHQTRLMDLMGRHMDVELLTIIASENAKGSSIARNLLESLARRYPNEFINAVNNIETDDPLVVAILSVFLRNPFLSLKKWLTNLPIETIVNNLYQLSRTVSGSEMSKFCDFLVQFSGQNGFIRVLHEAVISAVEDSSPYFVEIVLDVLEVAHRNGLLTYSEAFTGIFRFCMCAFLMEILEKRAVNANPVILRMQIESLDRRSSSRLEKYLNETAKEVNSAISESDMVLFGEEFLRTKVLPPKIVQLAMSNRTFFESFVEPLIRQMAKKNKCVKKMLKSMEDAKVVIKRDHHANPVTGIELTTNFIETIEESENYWELFNLFHRQLFTKHASHIPQFVDAFELDVLRPLSIPAQEKLADVIVDFLCGKLETQHRWSLSILALRCNISNHVPRIFECSCQREIDILIYLHKSAIVSSSAIRMKPLNNPNPLDIESKPMAIIDSIFIQRLRWRVLRGDSNDDTCWLPEFLRLCESDLVLFLKWECAEKSLFRLSEVLARIGVSTTASLYPQFLFEMLRIDPSEEVCSVMIPLFSKIPPDRIKIPEHPNLHLLFQTKVLWCSSVLCHPSVISCLRNPPPEVSQSLLNALPLDSNLDQLFSTFPHAFASLLYNFSSLSGTKPRRLCDAHHVVQGQFNLGGDLPKFAIVSVISCFARNGGELRLLARRMQSQTWVNYCLFFAICLHQNDVAIDLLQEFDFLFQLLRQGVAEENLFFGQGKWTDSLIEFAIYCAQHDVSFSEVRGWCQFLNCVRLSTWPDRLALDTENLCILRRYSSKYV